MLVIALVALAALAGGGYYVATQDSTPAVSDTGSSDVMTDEHDGVMEGDAMMEEEGAMMEGDDKGTTMVKGVTYEAYSAERLSVANTGPVVLFFHASWCPTCRAADSAISAGLNSENELTILKVDYDTSTALKQKYGVTYQHTFVQVDVNGNLVKKWSGSQNIDDIQREVQ